MEKAAPAAATIKTEILRILTKNDVAGSRTGVYVWNIDTGRQVYGRNSFTPLAPASNLKLLTSATALLDWGPDHRFMTGLYGPGGPSPNGTIHGDLYLRGYGDPSLSTLQYQRQVMHIKTSSFDAFAKKLRNYGSLFIGRHDPVAFGDYVSGPNHTLPTGTSISAPAPAVKVISDNGWVTGRRSISAE